MNDNKTEIIKDIVELLISEASHVEIEGLPFVNSNYPEEDCFDEDSMEIKNNNLSIKYLYIEVIYDRYDSIVDRVGKKKRKIIGISEICVKNNETKYSLIKDKETLCIFDIEKINDESIIQKLSDLFSSYKKIIRAEQRAASKAIPEIKIIEITKSEDVFNNDNKVEALRVDIPTVNGFEKCIALKKLIIGPNVKTIGPNAFNGCNQLKQIVFEEDGCLNSIEGFAVCAGIKKIEIPSSVEKVSGFYNCTGLERVTFKEDTKIKEISGFKFCSFLKQIDLRYDLNVNISSPSVAERVVKNFKGVDIFDTLEIESLEDLVKIRDVYKKIIFLDSLILEKLEITESFKNLESVYIGKGIYSLGENNFCNCSALKIIEISCESQICDLKGFNHNEVLSSINIPASVKTISGLNDCSSLSKVDIAENCRLEFIHGLKNTASELELKIKTTSEIKDGAFASLQSLTTVVLDKNLTQIPENAFMDCNKLETVLFEKDSMLREVGDFAFKNCNKLKQIILPKGVRNFSLCVFSGCKEDMKIIIDQ